MKTEICLALKRSKIMFLFSSNRSDLCLASVGAACPNCSYHPDSRSDIRDNNTLTYILETISVDSTTRGLMEEEGVPVQVEDADDTSSIELQFIVGFRGGLKGLQDYS